MTDSRKAQWVGALFVALALVLAGFISIIAVVAVLLAVFGTVVWSVGTAAVEVERQWLPDGSRATRSGGH